MFLLTSNLNRQRQFQQVQNDLEYNESLIREREEVIFSSSSTFLTSCQGIREIEEDIRKVNDIFVDLSTLVDQQDIMVGKYLQLEIPH